MIRIVRVRPAAEQQLLNEDDTSGNMLVLSWFAKAPGTAYVSRGEFRLMDAQDEQDLEQRKREQRFVSNAESRGITLEQLQDYVAEVTQKCETELKKIQVSLQKTSKLHRVMLFSAGLAAPVVLPKILGESHKIQNALFGPAPSLFVSISGAAVSEAVKRGFTQRGLYVMIKPAFNGSFCLIMTIGNAVPSNLRVYNRYGSPYPKHLRSVRLHAHDGSNRLASNHPTAVLQKAHDKRVNKRTRKGLEGIDESREKMVQYDD